MEIREILENIGYVGIKEQNGFYRMAALYRDGKNPSTLSINKESGLVTDFATNEKFSFAKLVSLTTGCSEMEAQKIVGGMEVIEKVEKKMSVPAKFEMAETEILLPAYYFYNNRGISTATLQEFGGGFCSWGRMSDRFCFKIYDRHGVLKGVAGRDVIGRDESKKWKICGRKSEGAFPSHINYEHLVAARSIIVVESIGCGLALWQAGIRNFLVLFGLSVGTAVLETILSVNPTEIIIATNNDEEKDGEPGRGQAGAAKIKTQLSKWFDEKIIKIKLPTKKDFGEMNKEEILNWHAAI